MSWGLGAVHNQLWFDVIDHQKNSSQVYIFYKILKKLLVGDILGERLSCPLIVLNYPAGALLTGPDKGKEVKIPIAFWPSSGPIWLVVI
jgi:hypothetical protein